MMGIAGMIGGIFGKSRAKKKEQAQARNEFASNRDYIDRLFAISAVEAAARGIEHGQACGHTATEITQDLIHRYPKATTFLARND